MINVIELLSSQFGDLLQKFQINMVWILPLHSAPSDCRILLVLGGFGEAAMYHNNSLYILFVDLVVT